MRNLGRGQGIKRKTLGHLLPQFTNNDDNNDNAMTIMIIIIITPSYVFVISVIISVLET